MKSRITDKVSKATLLLPSLTYNRRDLGIYNLLQQKSQFIGPLEQLFRVVWDGLN